MASKRATPIVVGVGDVKNASKKAEDAVEPMWLMHQAIKIAINDTELSPSATAELQSNIDGLDIVASWTWPYPDLPGLLSEKLGINPKRKYTPDYHAGTQPGKFFDEAARRISLGESKVAVLTGGEALASCMFLTTVISNRVERDAKIEAHGSGRMCRHQENASPWLDQAGYESRLCLFCDNP
jgi:hypothetical protein